MSFDFSEQGKPLGQALALENAKRVRAEGELEIVRSLLRDEGYSDKDIDRSIELRRGALSKAANSQERPSD